MATPTTNGQLVREIRNRQSKSEPFNGGILTADRYVDTIQACVGSDMCYRYFSKGLTSFDDVRKKASRTLTYNNPEMVVQDIYGEIKSPKLPDGLNVEVPKNTLMVFRNTLTTPRKDRDGDVLRTQGAKPDPRMLLLFNHVHTLPVGKMLTVDRHTSKELVLVTAIVDVNELSHDCAVMVENKMARFSHGFRALEFEKLKEDGKETGGFDVKLFEIMEESVVTVPSNIDAEVEDVLLSLGGKGALKSPMMKKLVKDVDASRDLTLNLHLSFDGNGNVITKAKTGQNADSKSCGCGGTTSASKETDEGDGKEQEGTEDDKMMCPKCGGKMVDGKCEKCGYRKGDDDNASAEDPEKEFERLLTSAFISPKEVADQLLVLGTKAGRVLSKMNYEKLVEVAEGLQELKDHAATRSGKALCDKCYRMVKEIIASSESSEGDDSPKEAQTVSVKTAASVLLTDSTFDEKVRIVKTLQALIDVEKRSQRTAQFKALKTGK